MFDIVINVSGEINEVLVSGFGSISKVSGVALLTFFYEGSFINKVLEGFTVNAKLKRNIGSFQTKFRLVLQFRNGSSFLQFEIVEGVTAGGYRIANILNKKLVERRAALKVRSGIFFERYRDVYVNRIR